MSSRNYHELSSRVSAGMLLKVYFVNSLEILLEIPSGVAPEMSLRVFIIHPGFIQSCF